MQVYHRAREIKESEIPAKADLGWAGDINQDFPMTRGVHTYQESRDNLHMTQEAVLRKASREVLDTWRFSYPDRRDALVTGMIYKIKPMDKLHETEELTIKVT